MFNKSTRMLLCVPPAYDRNVPPLGTPALKGFLLSKGVYASQADLNIPYFDYLKEEGLEHVVKPDFLAAKIKRKVYYNDVLRYRGGHQKLSYNFERNPGSSFAFTEKMLSSKWLFRYLKDGDENPFVGYFTKRVRPIMGREKPTMIGFSITCPSQVIASFTFGCLIKTNFPDIKIVIGGQWTSLFREALMRRSDFKSLYDYIIYFEGETPLEKLARAIESKGDLDSVPNLIYLEGDSFKLSSRVTEENMNNLPAPDFDGLPIMEYMDSRAAKRPVLTFETSRGCYWNKCTFCVDLPLPKPRYREKSPELIIRDMKTLKEKYNMSHLIISNATFSPSQMKGVSKMMLKRGLKITWWTFARLDSGFTYETLMLAKKAGCRMIGFGFETISQRLLDFIKKGTKVPIIKRIINDAHKLKLGIYFQAMTGIPTETVEDAVENITFLSRYKGAYNRNPGFNIYYLTPKNYIFEHPKECGIRFEKDPKLPFRYFHKFEHITGEVDRPTAERLIQMRSSLAMDRIKRDAKR